MKIFDRYNNENRIIAVNFAISTATALWQSLPHVAYSLAHSVWDANMNYFGIRDIVKFSERCNFVTAQGTDYSQDIYHVCQNINWFKNLYGVKYALDTLNTLKAPDYIEKPAAEAWKYFGEAAAFAIENIGLMVDLIAGSLPSVYAESLPNVTQYIYGFADSVRYNTDYITYNQDGEYNLLSVNALRGVVFHSITARAIGFYQLGSATKALTKNAKEYTDNYNNYIQYDDYESAIADVIQDKAISAERYAKFAQVITVGFATSAVYHTQVESNLEEALDNLKITLNKCHSAKSCTNKELFEALDKYDHNDYPRSVFLGDTIVFPALWSLNDAIHKGIISISYYEAAKTLAYKNSFLPTFVGKLYDVVDERREELEDILTGRSLSSDGRYPICIDLLGMEESASSDQ